MKSNIIKYFTIIATCLVCITADAQRALKNAKAVLSKNILDLDPIEGIYEVETLLSKEIFP